MAVTQPLTAVKRGNTRVETTMDWSHSGSRTKNQHEGVLAHFRRHPAAWICGNPFASDRPGQRYNCGFAVSYFDMHGRMCGFWVEPGGKITGFTADYGDENAEAEALKVIREHGLFRGGQ